MKVVYNCTIEPERTHYYLRFKEQNGEFNIPNFGIWMLLIYLFKNRKKLKDGGTFTIGMHSQSST
jgi:hypothetical protein